MMNKLKKFKIVENGKYFVILPVIVLVIAAIVFTSFSLKFGDAQYGMNVGIDFAGGSLVTVTLGDDRIGTKEGYEKELDKITSVITSEDIAKQVSEFAATEEIGIKLPENLAKAKITYEQTSGSSAEMAIIIKYNNVAKNYDTASNAVTLQRNKLIEEKLKEIYSEDNGYDAKISASYIGPTASASLLQTALLATAITIVLILIYIVIRFELWSGLAAIVGLAHDVAIMILLTIIFRIQVNSSFIAAVITIVSYSINNTIVVFDRVRENMKNEKKLAKGHIDVNAVVNTSVRDTALRSINSTVTTLFAIAIFAILGSVTVQEFALPVIFGLFAGFYSSMFLAPALYCGMKNSHDKHKKMKKEKESKPKYAGVKN